jgi:hypothetical protein
MTIDKLLKDNNIYINKHSLQNNNINIDDYIDNINIKDCKTIAKLCNKTTLYIVNLILNNI